MTVGDISTVSVDTTSADKLLRLLDTVVIKLEGGSEDDLKILDEKPTSEIRIHEPKIDVKINTIVATTQLPEEAEPTQTDNSEVKTETSVEMKPNQEDEVLDSDKVEDQTNTENENNTEINELEPRSGEHSPSNSPSNSSSSSSSNDSENEDEKKETIEDEDDHDEKAVTSDKSSDSEAEENNKNNESEEENENNGKMVEGNEKDMQNDDDNNEEELEKGDEQIEEDKCGIDINAKKDSEIEQDEVTDTIDSTKENVEKEENDENDENKTITIDLDKVKEVEVEKGPRALHRTSSIFLRNLAPTITKSEVEVMCKRYPGFLRVAIADPLLERRWFRRGWVTFIREVNIKEICWNLNNIRVSESS